MLSHLCIPRNALSRTSPKVRVVAKNRICLLTHPPLQLQKRSFYGSPGAATILKQTHFQKFIRSAPPEVLPYLKLLRLDLPIGSYLLFWPCAWGLLMATPATQLPNFYYLFLFGVGSVLMRGAGCVINDLWDRNIDKQVERTKDRPIANGTISPKKAILLLFSQLILALGVLLQFNWFSVFLGFASIPLVVFYPTFKRFFNLPQLILGLTFNWGALMGFAVLHGTVSLPMAVPLYLGGVAWTLHYDTIYAHQDKADDLLVGVKSTALTFGDSTKSYLAVFSSLVVSLISLSGYMNELGILFYVGMSVSAVHLFWQINSLHLNNSIDCAAKFRANKFFGFIVFISIVLGKYIPF